MEITGPQSPTPLDLLRQSPQGVVDAWKVGQLLRATAVTAQQAGQATINVGGTLLLAQTQYPLKAGQPLQLEVSGLSANTVLKVVGELAGKGLTVSLPPQPALISQLQAGQVLQATLSLPAEPAQTRTLLQLAGQQVNVQLSRPLPPNMDPGLKLEVVTPGRLPTLSILTPAPTSNTPDIQQALRSTLPRQTPLAPLLANLALVANSGARTAAPTMSAVAQPAGARLNVVLPQPVIELARQVVDGLPRVDTLSTAEGLKQAVAQSGLFLEARLAQTAQSPPSSPTAIPNLPLDFKGSLLSLLASLLTLTKAVPSSGTPPPTTPPGTGPMPAQGPAVPTPPPSQATLTPQMTLQQTLLELLRHVEGGLARLQLSQLVTQAHHDDDRRSWIMELPLRFDEHLDLIQLHIEKELKRQHKKPTALWTVTLSFDLPSLGPVQARVTLAGKTIHTSFWAQRPQTTDLIHDHLPTLQQRLREAGLTVGSLHAHEGPAPQAASLDSNLPQVLLDVQA